MIGINLNMLSLEELRNQWAKSWGKQPHGLMGKAMMIKSIEYKRWEKETGGLSIEQKFRLEELIKSYKRNPDAFDKAIQLKPGTRLVRTWKGKKYCVEVKREGFEYDGKHYSSLSHIANTITGSRWNGWAFFGLKKS